MWVWGGESFTSSARAAIAPMLTGMRRASFLRSETSNTHIWLHSCEKLAEGNRHNVDEDLVRFLRSFDDEDVRATADYLSRLRGPGHVHKTMRPDGTVVD